ncbi:glycosyltransferase [Paenibacillus sp. PL2-23]|uniref:glycosyltransferase family 2 protein n=1 Tax=Paenibacillus sp. PL2-23 TaxID=2100729 RepID=UPI0030FD003E
MKSLATQIIQLLDMGYECVSYLKSCIVKGELRNSDILMLDDMVDLTHAISGAITDFELPNRVNEISENLLYYIDQLKRLLNEDDVEDFLFDFRFHFCSLFRILEFEVAYILEDVIDKNEFPRLYPEVNTINHEEIVALGQEARYKVSVVLLAYNNLSYTRDCVESILTHTIDIDYELILVDNGSTDGTKEYFDSIPDAKVIHLKHNIHLVKGFNIGLMAAEGKYCAAVCNDFIFTPNWLMNLLTCIESDSSYGFVSPGATSISNMQQISIPFISKEDFLQRAKEYNVSDSSKWEERVVLLPNVLCCPTALLDHIGYYDTRFYRGEFLDDDISFRIRRAGYKLIYCGDTVAHHYGSLTTASDHLTNSLDEGRKIFINKYGLDAWTDARMQPDFNKIDFSGLNHTQSILGIDVKCGATLLQIKNRIWSKRLCTPQLHVLTTDSKYIKDLNTIAERVDVIESLAQFPVNLDETYDLVYIEQPLNYYEDNLEGIFKNFGKKLNQNGHFIFKVSNCISFEAIYNMLNASETVHNQKIYINEWVNTCAQNCGFEPISIINFSSERKTDESRIINEISNLLARGQEEGMQYVNSKLNLSYTMYQMKFNDVRSL